MGIFIELVVCYRFQCYFIDFSMGARSEINKKHLEINKNAPYYDFWCNQMKRALGSIRLRSFLCVKKPGPNGSGLQT